MNDYSILRIWHSEATIAEAISYAKTAAKYSRVKESYFPENMKDFEPHTWVVEVICEMLEPTGYILELK